MQINLRLNTPTFAGYGWYTQFLLDGEPLDAARSRNVLRLINKPLTFTNQYGVIAWNLGDGLWHTFFAPSFTTDPSAYYPPGLAGDPYTDVLDITDLVADGQPHSLIARNLWTGNDLVLSISTATGSSGPGQSTPTPPRLAGRPTMTVSPHGGVVLRFGDVSVPFVSDFSVPGGGAQNTLGTHHYPQSERHWKTRRTSHGRRRATVEAQGSSYSVQRQVTMFDDHITVADTFTNLTGGAIGIQTAHYIDFQELDNFDAYFSRMGGRYGPAVNNVVAATNPTLFCPLDQSALGIVMNDDVLRNHATLFYDGDSRTTGLRDDYFALDAYASYTTNWSVYFTQSSDYYDFINAVRRDWESNITLDGPLYFLTPSVIAGWTDDQLKAQIDIHDAHDIVFWQIQNPGPTPQWGSRTVVGMGVGVFDQSLATQRAELETAVARVRRVAPDARVGWYVHAYFISPEDPDGLTYEDSWIVGSNGQRAVSVYNVPSRVDYQPVYPRVGDSYAAAFERVIDYAIDDLGLDWLYWDESNWPGVVADPAFADVNLARSTTFNDWDAHSALIDATTKTISQKFALLPLRTSEFYGQMRNKVRAARGGFILYNEAAVTRDRQQERSFVETQSVLANAYMTHLNTPLAYGGNTPTVMIVRSRLDLGLLYARTSLDYSSDVVKHCYPFTPTGLHRGWVEGKERVITAYSGQYGWDDAPYDAQILLFNADGSLQPNPVQLRGQQGKVTVQVPELGIAILERTDVP